MVQPSIYSTCREYSHRALLLPIFFRGSLVQRFCPIFGYLTVMAIYLNVILCLCKAKYLLRAFGGVPGKI